MMNCVKSSMIVRRSTQAADRCSSHVIRVLRRSRDSERSRNSCNSLSRENMVVSVNSITSVSAGDRFLCVAAGRDHQSFGNYRNMNEHNSPFVNCLNFSSSTVSKISVSLSTASCLAIHSSSITRVGSPGTISAETRTASRPTKTFMGGMSSNNCFKYQAIEGVAYILKVHLDSFLYPRLLFAKGL